MLKKYFRVLAVASVVASVSLFAAGCSQKTVKTDAGADASVPAVDQEGQMREPVQPIGTEESLDSAPMGSVGELNILEGRTTGPMLPIYFDFDQFNVRADQQSRVVGNSTHLKNNSMARVVIEGNCDERGTNEYNMALGERRAISAKKYLVNLGVAESRVSTISYGEERPLNHGHDEHAWSQNRRADFVEIR